jgi:hypothetical protein
MEYRLTAMGEATGEWEVEVVVSSEVCRISKPDESEESDAPKEFIY